jgi:hypothetical protein
MAQLVPACFIDLILIYLRENINYIEERMAQLVPHSIPLRLTCLLAHCGDGLAAGDLARLKTQLVQAYGFQHLLTWSNLLKLGLIKPKVFSCLFIGLLLPFVSSIFIALPYLYFFIHII